MRLIKNKKYNIQIKIGDRTLGYTGEVIEVDSMFVTILDKFNEEVSFNLDSIITFKEINQ